MPHGRSQRCAITQTAHIEANGTRRYERSHLFAYIATFTWNTNYILQQIYAQHLDRVEYYSKAENSFLSTHFTSGVNPRGKCGDWKGTTSPSCCCRFDYVYFSKMEMYVQRIDYGTDVQDSLNATCSDRNVIANILSALVSGDHCEKICGEVSWRVFTCGGNRMICLNCKHNCTESEACPAASMSLNYVWRAATITAHNRSR